MLKEENEILNDTKKKLIKEWKNICPNTSLPVELINMFINLRYEFIENVNQKINKSVTFDDRFYN